VTISILWALLPLPFAARVIRRSQRKRARAEYDAQTGEAPS
jgi:hypothetical protein